MPQDNKAPAVSVLIASRNYGRFLPQCLDSVMAQTFTDYEIVLVDDGSEDDTQAVAGRYPGLRYVRQEHRGVAAARNNAVGQARADWLAWLDADDYWPEDRLRFLYSRTPRWQARRELVFGSMRNFFAGDVERGHPMAGIMAARTQGALPSLALLPKAIFTECGPYDETLPYGEDTDFMTRLQFHKVGFVFCRQVVLHRRLHSGNASLTLRLENGAQMHRKILLKNLRAFRAGRP